MPKPDNHVDDINCGCMQCQADDDAYDDETLPDECECWEYESVDPLTGRATCDRCGSRRYLSGEQMRSLERAQAEYDEAMAQEFEP